MGQQDSLNVASPGLFDDFLKEVQVLDDFRAEYSKRYEFEGLGRQDQDVQRLIEAMAFYSARTRRTAERAVEDYKRLALERLFPHLLSPMPEMALLFPVLGANTQETRALPVGAPIALTPIDPGLASATKFFRTVEPLTVFPIHIVERSVKVQRQVGSTGIEQSATVRQEPKWTLQLEIAASPSGPGKKRYYDDVQLPLTELRLQLNPVGDLLLCLRAFDALKESFTKVTCRFFSDGASRHEIERRSVRFGSPKETPAEGFDNPIESARRLIHFPLTDCCLSIDVSGAPSEWDLLRLEFEMNDQWPAGVALGDSSFLLNAVAVENLQRCVAEPVEVNGERLRLPISHPEPSTGMSVREVHGVYVSDPGAAGARKPLFPNLLIDGGYSLELHGSSRAASLRISPSASAALEPQTVYIDCSWYQPAPLKEPARVSTEASDLGAIRWVFATPTREAQLSPVGQDIGALEQLLELHGARELNAENLRHLLHALGVGNSEAFGRVPRYLSTVTTEFVPDSQAALGGIRSYDLGFRKVPNVLIPAVRHLGSLLAPALAAWTGESEIRVTVIFEEQPELGNREFTWRVSDV
ncbi:MAG: hypothetical protein RJA70_1071 [Pseudomonadota bacterium]|jgi:type VI secretion system protein ImpG